MTNKKVYYKTALKIKMVNIAERLPTLLLPENKKKESILILQKMLIIMEI